MDSHLDRVRSLRDLGGERLVCEGREFWGIFDDGYQPVGFSDRTVYGQELAATISDGDLGDIRRGSIVVRPNGKRYAVETAPQPHDRGMIRLVLVAKQ